MRPSPHTPQSNSSDEHKERPKSNHNLKGEVGDRDRWTILFGYLFETFDLSVWISISENTQEIRDLNRVVSLLYVFIRYTS